MKIQIDRKEDLRDILLEYLELKYPGKEFRTVSVNIKISRPDAIEMWVNESGSRTEDT